MQHLPPARWRNRDSYFPGSRVVLFLDSQVAGADMYAGINTLEPGAEIPLHWHSVGEFQFILAGHGVVLSPRGNKSVGVHDGIFSPAGPGGAHGFRNTGRVPLLILFVYPAEDGVKPTLKLAAETRRQS